MLAVEGVMYLISFDLSKRWLKFLELLPAA